MNKEYHLLNGDALSEQFPHDLPGEKIVARLCLVDGDVSGDNFEELFSNRSKFISSNYQVITKAEYFTYAVEELSKMKLIAKDANLNLWFEEDLFCQVNLWFVLYYLKQNNIEVKLSLVMPKDTSPYSFGAMTKGELKSAFQNKKAMSREEFESLASIWPFYQKTDLEEIEFICGKHKEKYPFLIKALNAHRVRLDPKDENHPKSVIHHLIKTQKTKEFGPVFKAFSVNYRLFGFGDVQVKRLFDEVIKENF